MVAAELLLLLHHSPLHPIKLSNSRSNRNNSHPMKKMMVTKDLLASLLMHHGTSPRSRPVLVRC